MLKLHNNVIYNLKNDNIHEIFDKLLNTLYKLSWPYGTENERKEKILERHII